MIPSHLQKCKGTIPVTTYDATSVRLQLLANGYCPTPNLDKRCMLKGWTSQAFVDGLSEETIKAWKKSTGASRPPASWSAMA